MTLTCFAYTFIQLVFSESYREGNLPLFITYIRYHCNHPIHASERQRHANWYGIVLCLPGSLRQRD